jgi:hypothetical protein
MNFFAAFSPKELFAGFRDDCEMVQQCKGVIAACLSEAFDQLSRDDGNQLLKKIAGKRRDTREGELQYYCKFIQLLHFSFLPFSNH